MAVTASHVRSLRGFADDSPWRFWSLHARIPLAILIVATIVANSSMVDAAIARALFFDASRQQWLGAHNWWTTTFLHDGGRWAVRGIVAASLMFWISTYIQPHSGSWRRPSLYFTVAMILSIGLVGLLKVVTNMDCPWDLQEFGGRSPYLHLFAHRPVELGHAQCFPAAHASSGYALMALYFVARERSAGLARIGLAIGLVTGLVFGIAQQSRGAHFLSHDIWSACITWLVSLTLYTFAFRMRAWRQPLPH